MKRALAWAFLLLVLAPLAQAAAMVEEASRLRHRAAGFARQGDFPRALEASEGALRAGESALGQAHPGLVPLLLDLASLRRELAQYQEAEAALLRCLGLKGQDPGLLGHLAAVHREMGRLDLSLAEFDLALDLAKNSGDKTRAALLRSRAGLKAAMQRPDTARLDYAEALSLNPEDAFEISLDLAGVLLLFKEYDGAHKILNSARPGEDALKQASLAEARAAAFKAQGLHDSALAQWQAAERIRRGTLGPALYESLPLIEKAAVLYLNLGDLAKAKELHEKLLAGRRNFYGKIHPLTVKAVAALEKIPALK